MRAMLLERPAPVKNVGDRVGIPWLHTADGTCTYCRRDEESLCGAARACGVSLRRGRCGRRSGSTTSRPRTARCRT